MKVKDYYETLGVTKDASDDDIKKAFRRLARRYHPDVSKEADAEARMKQINEAFAVLSDPEKRAEYDRMAQGYNAGEEFRSPPNWEHGFSFGSGTRSASFSDVFSEIFGGLGGDASPGDRRFRTRGEDEHAQIELDLEDSYSGATRTLTLRAPQVDHRGYVTYAEQTFSVRIPKGVREGQVIRLKGQGRPGSAGGEPGDLYLEVRFKPHPRYRTENRDVLATLPIAPWEAALGAKVQAVVPDGTVEVRIPPGSQSGRKLRLKGRGLPGSPPGDLYLVLEVVLPPASTSRARELYETMAHDLAFNPRQDSGV